jgi:tRNA(Glu) U13 pseudouridine synthase TruD
LILLQHPDYDQDQKSRKQEIYDLIFGSLKGTTALKTRENIEYALALLDRRDRLEKTVLISLRNSPNDFYNAFTSISKNTRFIYIHAYQSYVWNRAVSERLRRHGRAVLIGDLVIKAGSKQEELLNEDVDLVELGEEAEG